MRMILADSSTAAVRPIGIDTPETRDSKEPDGCFGVEGEPGTTADEEILERLLGLNRLRVEG